MSGPLRASRLLLAAIAGALFCGCAPRFIVSDGGLQVGPPAQSEIRLSPGESMQFYIWLADNYGANDAVYHLSTDSPPGLHIDFSPSTVTHVHPGSGVVISANFGAKPGLNKIDIEGVDSKGRGTTVSVQVRVE
jgi:hypothetical protein